MAMMMMMVLVMMTLTMMRVDDEDFDEDDEDDEDFDDGDNVDIAKVQMLLAIGHSFSLMPQSLLFNSSAMIVKMILVLICLLSFVFP